MASTRSALILALSLVLLACAGDLEGVDRQISDGRYAEAEKRARELLSQLEVDNPGDGLREAQILDRLVLARFRGGKSLQAETRVLAERALLLKEALLAGDDPELCESLDQLGWILGSGGDPDSGIGLLERSLAIRERGFGPESQEVSWTLNFLAPLLWDLGDYAAARPLYERALAIRRKNGIGIAGVLNNLGVLAYDMGDYASALRYYKETLEIRVAADPEHPHVMSTMVNLALVYWREGAHREASRLARDALEMQERLLTPEDEAIGITLFALGDIEVSLGHPRRALPRYERSLRILANSMGADHPFLVRPLLGFANALAAAGDLDGSREQVQRAVRISTRRLSADHPYTSTSRSQLAVALLEAGDKDACLRMALTAEAGSRRHLRLTSRAFAERQSLDYASARASGLDVALTLAASGLKPSQLDEVFDAVVRSRALVLDEMAARGKLLAELKSPDIERLAAELAAARTRLANLMVRGVSGDPERHGSQLEAARQEVVAAEALLAQGSAPFRREQERNKVGLDDVRRDLPPNSALVALARYHHYEPGSTDPVESYLALVLRAGTTIAVPLARADEIDILIEGWRENVALSSGTADLEPAEAEETYRRIATDLRRRVWDPISAKLGGTDLVFVVPDGALHTVNLATLPTPDGGYMVESGPSIHYLSAERDLVALNASQAEGRGLLALGNPDFDASDSDATTETTFRGIGSAYRSFDEVTFRRLPQSAAEIDTIARAWESHGEQGLDVYIGSAATEWRFKREAPGKRTVHVATHGFFLGGGSESRPAQRRSIGLAGAGGKASVVKNPLVFSGLAFAGANQRDDAAPDEEDGVLTAEEIATLDLHAVEWVVLSACDTGLGEIRDGEGVLGLRRALQLAGARTLIMSLWSVDDKATRRFMTELYRVRLQGANTIDSVRDASLTCLLERRRDSQSTHPFFWGAFVATGGWN